LIHRAEIHDLAGTSPLNIENLNSRN
jgi:hypothetical protein